MILLCKCHSHTRMSLVTLLSIGHSLTSMSFMTILSVCHSHTGINVGILLYVCHSHTEMSLVNIWYLIASLISDACYQKTVLRYPNLNMITYQSKTLQQKSLKDVITKIILNDFILGYFKLSYRVVTSRDHFWATRLCHQFDCWDPASYTYQQRHFKILGPYQGIPKLFLLPPPSP